MKQGRTLAEVMQQVEKEAKAKRDLIVPAQSIFMGDEADWIGMHWGISMSTGTKLTISS